MPGFPCKVLPIGQYSAVSHKSGSTVLPRAGQWCLLSQVACLSQAGGRKHP